MGKGQAAAEYLVLLAMVVLVALIAIVILGGFTATGASSMDAESHTYWSSQPQPFVIDQWAQVGDTIYIEVQNKALERLVLTNVSFDGAVKDLSGTGWTFGPGEKKNLTFGGLPTCNQTSYDSFSYAVAIYYDSQQITGKREAGAKPLAGSCSFP